MKRIVIALLLAALAVPAFPQSVQNMCGTPLASAARTATTVNTPTLQNQSFRGAVVTVNVSAYTSGQYIAHLQAAVPATPTVFYDILASAAINGTGTTSYTIYPGVTVASNVAVSQVLPRLWRVSLAGTSTPSMTFSVDVCYAN